MEDKKVQVALTSVGAALFLTAIKLGVGLWTNSLGILAEALHSGLDMVAAIITFFAVYFSKKPADSEHQYGHGKIENFSALIETLILIITCGWIIYEAFQRLIHQNVHVEVNIFSFGVIILAIVIDYERSRMLFKVAKATNSQALEADALHFSTDILSSAVVLVGLFSVFLGFPLADAIAALIVAVIVIWISVRLGMSTINALMDKVPKEEYNKIRNLFETEFKEFPIKQLRLRPSGPEFIGDITLEIPKTMNINDFHAIRSMMQSKVENVIPKLDLTVIAHPISENYQSMGNFTNHLSSIILSDHLFYKVHNITYYSSNSDKILDLHLLLPNELSLKEAHELSDEYEQKVKNFLDVGEINIHLEPIDRKNSKINNYSFNDNTKSDIKKIISKYDEIKKINKIDCSTHKNRIILYICVEMASNKNLVEVHDLTEAIESDIYSIIPNVANILIHTEPFFE